MTKLPIRMLAVGLGAVSLSGCLVIPPDAINERGPNSPVTSSPTASPVATNNSVRRSAPPPPALMPANPNTPVQYIAIPADQLVYDASGRAMAKADAIPPGYMPVIVPPNAPSPQAGPTLTQAPTTMATMNNGTPTILKQESVDVVSITHTPEPPLAAGDASKKANATPKSLPDAVAKMQTLPTVANKSEPLPAIVNDRNKMGAATGAQARVEQPAPGSQMLVFQQPPAYNATIMTPRQTVSADAGPNLLIPPVAPEELKLVSTPKTPCCSGPLNLALKAYQDRQPDDADRQLAQLDPASRELLKKLLPLAARLGDSGMPSADPADFAEVIDQLQTMVGTLRSKAALRIEKLTYCRTPAKPVRIGTYQPLPEDHTYRPGETVELYMELRNFSCEAKDREFMTHLNTAIEIRDERNEVVAHFDFERDRPDVGSAPKQEYFHICRFPVQSWPAGQYTLCATVTDVPTGKSVTKTLPLRVEAARRVARGSAE